MNVSKAAQGVLRELEARGYTDWTLDLHRRNSMRIQRWFHGNYDGEITQMAVEAYLTEIEDRFQSGNIGKLYYYQLHLIAKRLYEHSKNEHVSLVCSPNKRENQPSADSITTIENALSATELMEDFKCKLHVILRKFFCFTEDQELVIYDITRDVMVSSIHHCRDSNSGSMEYLCTKTIYQDYTETRRKYDDKYRLVQEIDEEGRVTSYTYNNHSQMTGVTRHNGAKTTLTYDNAGRLVSTTNPWRQPCRDNRRGRQE